jgi:regulator of protease activity HflC (stomatin/prohibitin superfamily)
VVIAGLTVVTGTFVGLSAGVSAYSRAQQRANAENRANLARIDIKRAHELALVARAQVQTSKANAEKQYQDALGTRRAQQVISSGLTPQYLQYEAIQAQKAIATSGRNNTLIYMPSGRTGVPLVQDPQNVNRLKSSSGG